MPRKASQSPNIVIRRGTSPEVHMRWPRMRPLPTPTTTPGPSRKVASWTATSADDAYRDEPALHEARGDVAEREAFVVAPEEGERDDGGADVGDDEQQLQGRADEDAGVAAAGAEHEVLVVERRVVQQHGRDADDERRDPRQTGDR